jgi:hypothetical protein
MTTLAQSDYPPLEPPQLPPTFFERLRELTSDNEHTLALWFIASRLNDGSGQFCDQESFAARLFAEHMLAGELTSDLHQQYLHSSDGLMARIGQCFGADFAQRIRGCL